MKTLEAMCLVLLYIYLSGAFFGLTDGIGHEANVLRADGNEAFLAIQLTVYAGTFVFALIHAKRILHYLTCATLPLALAGFAMVSTFWSSDPQITSRKACVLMASTFAGLLVGTCCDGTV
jgi:hypothetical protein